jgi:hypothetical protein
MLHARDHLCLPIYQLIRLPIHLLFLSIHFYFLNNYVGVDGILRPIWVLFDIKFLLLCRLSSFYCLSECLKILVTGSHRSL